MASMFLSLDDNAITPEFQSAYDELTGRLRAIVHDLRPAMLNYGLKPALNELVDSLIERDKNGLQIGLELDTDENRYPLEVEQHLFRIVQEACENSLRHGHACKISITGALKPDGINLTIADNGAGFDAGEVFDLANLLANRHFGLAGMLERARMIGGDVKINSSQTTGTRVSFRWALSKS
jgi:signal transduction histidine kinase